MNLIYLQYEMKIKQFVGIIFVSKTVCFQKSFKLIVRHYVKHNLITLQERETFVKHLSNS